MKKNKTLIGLLALGVLSTSMLAGCDEAKSPESGEVEETKDQEAADGVIAKINALTDASSESDVVAARTAYEALTAAQKALVTNVVKLEAQEKRVADDKLVKEVVDAIAGLTNESTEDQVNDVYAMYQNLDDALKSKVTNLATLLEQKARIDAKVIVDPVIEMIRALNDQSTKEEVKAAEAAYLALTEDDRKYIDESVVELLNAQLARVLNAEIAAVQEFIDGVVVEDLISDAAVIEVVKAMGEIELSESIIKNLTDVQKEKLALLKKTTDSYEYAGVNQAKSWRDPTWEHDSYGSLSFAEAVVDADLNAKVRSFEVTYFNDGENTHQEFGITLVGDSNLKDSKKQAVFYLFNPDIDTNMRIDFAKGTEESFCDGGTIALKHGWNRVEIALNDVSDKNVINLMVGILNNEGGVTETTGWKISSFVKYDDTVSGAIRTEYYRIAKIMNAYLNNEEETERNEYAIICEEYAKLTAAEKEMLPEGVAAKIAADEIKFKAADAEALNDLLGQISPITDRTDIVKYASDYLVKLTQYKEQYDAFDDDQKALVTNAAILDGLELLSSYKVLSDGSKQFKGWADYAAGPDSVTDTDSNYGTVQKVTLDTADQTAMLFPVLDGYDQCDVVYFTVYCPEGHMDIVASSPYWPYNFGTLEVGWNTVCVPTEVFAADYPANTIGLFLYGVGDWKFGSAIGFVNTKGAEDLVEVINGLTYTGKTSEETAIANARVAYNALGMVSKTLVSNLSKLEELETAVDQHYADAVIAEIAALEFDPQGSTQDTQKAAIEAARASYDALSDARKALVSNLSKLEEMEAAVAQYYKDQLVNALKDKIDGLVEITSAIQFDVALENYVKTDSIKADQFYADEIDDTRKAKVEGVITAFESIYTKISDAVDGPAGSPTITAKKDSVYGDVISVSGSDANVQLTYKPSDKGVVANYDYIYVLMRTEVDGGFNLWGSTWSSSDDVQTIGGLVGETWNIVKINTSNFNTAEGKSENFNQLDFCLGDLTNNHEVLMTAAYGFVDTDAAKAVTEQIAALTYTEYSEGEENAIAAARSAYDALGKGSKSAVTNYETLTSMETAVDAHYVAPVIEAIEALEFDPEGSTQEAQKTAIEAARAAYNALSDTRKAMVTNLSKLEEMEAAVAAYYKAERLATLEGEISALPEEITTATEVIDVMKIKVALAKYEAHDLYAELQQTSKDKIAALKEDISEIYTTLLDGTSALLGWDYGSVGDTTSGTDDEFGAIQKITFEDDAQHSLRLPTSEEYEKCDEVYISVYCPSGSLTLVNGSYWPYAYGSVSVGWNIIKVPGNVFAETYPSHSLGFLFNGAGEWKIGMVLGCAAEPVPEPTTEVIYSGNAINSDKTNWEAFTETGVDATYGNYKIMNLSAFNGTIQVIVNGATTISPSKYTNVTFAIYNPCEENATLENIIAMNSDWGTLATACGGTTLVPGWNEITFNSSLLGNPSLNMVNIKIALGESTQDGWKISEFVATKANLTATSYHFGQVTDTGEDDPIYGNIYNLIQDQWFIDNPDAATMAAFGPGTLSALLADGQTELVFKIYNPNAEVVNFHIAGGNPWADAPTTISLAPEAWTEVVISAADIAVTDVAGANYYFYIGSSNTAGWKVTDIFAK